MSTSGRDPGDCRAWLDSGYVCGLPRDNHHGRPLDQDAHQDTDTGDVWWDDDTDAHPAPPPGPVPTSHPNHGKPDLDK